MNKKVIIIHEYVHDYRMPLFKELSTKVQLTIAYSKSFSKLNDINTIKISKKVTYNLVVFINIFKILRNFDVVILPLDLHYPQFFIYCLLYPKKVIWFGHGVGKRKIAYHIRLPFLKISKSIILYYMSAKSRLKSNRINPNKIFVTYNTIKVENKGVSSEKRNYFIFVGRIQPRKKIINACIAINNINRLFREKQLKFLIVGNGDVLDIKNYIHQNNLEDIIILKEGTYNEILLKDYFKNAIAYISPGPIGLAVLHSFAYGIPVITSFDVKHGPEYENIKNFNNSILYDGSIFELTECLKFFIYNQSVSFYLGGNAYIQYSSERQIDNMVKAFTQAINYE